MTQNTWYNTADGNEPAAISTRVRLARNLRDMPFPRLLDVEQRYAVCKKVVDGFNAAMGDGASDFDVIDMGKLNGHAAMSLAERRLVSPEFVHAGEGSCLLLSKDHSISIMINEEDHVRIQALASGLQLAEAYRVADSIDNKLNAVLGFAYDGRLGYLTECPTNLGTGLRASVMLHLPAMRADGSVNRLAETVSRLGFTVRGAYGEESEAVGSFYQISNQITLGISEKSAVDNLNSIVKQIIATEENAREQLIARPDIQDKLWRSLGVLRTARRISGTEAVELASNLRLGIERGVFKGEKIGSDVANRIISLTGASTIMAQKGADMTPDERDTARAEIIREIIGK